MRTWASLARAGAIGGDARKVCRLRRVGRRAGSYRTLTPPHSVIGQPSRAADAATRKSRGNCLSRCVSPPRRGSSEPAFTATECTLSPSLLDIQNNNGRPNCQGRAFSGGALARRPRGAAFSFATRLWPRIERSIIGTAGPLARGSDSVASTRKAGAFRAVQRSRSTHAGVAPSRRSPGDRHAP